MDQDSLPLATQQAAVQPIHVNLDGVQALFGGEQSLQRRLLEGIKVRAEAATR
jgi:hypothetical protein